MKKNNKKTLANVKGNHTATTTQVENPSPKMTKEEKEAKKKAQAEALKAEKAARKAANIEANQKAHEKNVEAIVKPQTNDGTKVTVSRRTNEGYIHFLRRKHRAQRRLRRLELNKLHAQEKKQYDLMIHYDAVSGEMVKNTIKEKIEPILKKLSTAERPCECKIMTDTFAYIKYLDAETIEKIKAILAPAKTKKGFLHFQSYKPDVFRYTKKEHSKNTPTNNTAERRAANAKPKNGRFAPSAEKRNELKKQGIKGRNAKRKRHSSGSNGKLSGLQRKAIQIARKAAKAMDEALNGKPKSEPTSTPKSKKNKQLNLPLSA